MLSQVYGWLLPAEPLNQLFQGPPSHSAVLGVLTTFARQQQLGPPFGLNAMQPWMSNVFAPTSNLGQGRLGFGCPPVGIVPFPSPAVPSNPFSLLSRGPSDLAVATPGAQTSGKRDLTVPSSTKAAEKPTQPLQPVKVIKRHASDVQEPATKRAHTGEDSDSSVDTTFDNGSSIDEEDAVHVDAFCGERRLVMKFQKLGTCVSNPPRVGSTGAIVPTGLVGCFTAYSEDWQIETFYETESPRLDGEICVVWKVTNLKTGMHVERQETQREAKARQQSGRTITNQLFRQALDQRVRSLHHRLHGEINETRIANMQSLIKILSPTRFTQGPLFFGMQHRCVQKAMANILNRNAEEK